MLGHKSPNPGLVLCIFHVSVSVRLVYNALYFLWFLITYKHFFVTVSQDCGALYAQFFCVLLGIFKYGS